MLSNLNCACAVVHDCTLSAGCIILDEIDTKNDNCYMSNLGWNKRNLCVLQGFGYSQGHR